MKFLLWLLLCLSVNVQAVDGAWHASSTGPGMQNRGVQASSRPLVPPQVVEGAITEVVWRYSLTAPAPVGLQVRLCSSNRCVPLEGGSGTTLGLNNVNAGETLHFIYHLEGKGRVFPQVRVISNDVMVNYR